MRKCLALLLIAVLFFGVVGCSGEGEKVKNLEGSLEEILDKIYETAALSADFREHVIPRLETMEIDEENVEYYLGTGDVDLREGIASESMITSSAYSLCLVRANEGAEIEKIKEEIKNNVDPRKWICVGVDPSNVIVDNIGDVVILIMSNDDSQELHQAFLELAK